jgi:hypothetical protein
MLRPVDNYFLQHEEPVKSCLQFLRQHILTMNEDISEKWHYGMPFYFFRGKRVCYLWVHKKLYRPYLGIVDGKLINHPDLLIEKRSRMKILLIDPARNIPLRKINLILKEAIALYK